MIWKILSTSISGVLLLTALGTAFFGFRKWRSERAQRRREFLSAYLREYRSAEMGRAIHELWQLFKDCGGDPHEMSNVYKTKWDSEPQKTFHFDIRRKVSAFYQEMAFLAEDKDIADILYQVWTEGDLRIIRDVILPLELEAVPRVLGPMPKKEDAKIQIEEKWSPAFKAMAKLYNGAHDRQKKENKKAGTPKRVA
jgi:hypothetical protein